jgi:hypothetical protein
MSTLEKIRPVALLASRAQNAPSSSLRWESLEINAYYRELTAFE